MIMLKKLFRRKKDLRELCRERYGDDFVMKYDTINRGGTIGGLSETIAFIEMVEEVKRTSDWKQKNTIGDLICGLFRC